jgi:translation initiation factor IF-3
MLKLLFRNTMWLAQQQRFRLEDYSKIDFATMCGLLREKYFLNNEEIQTSGLIKLLDDAGKVIGIYTASEGRKKAQALGLDMVLVTNDCSPVICKASDFRGRLISRFYQEIVIKRQKERIMYPTQSSTKQPRSKP